ncbi:MAG TPA: TIGR04190 family B12-binding domain/radical SAM domain protein [Candidatus Limnocylindrales bacterium]|nr:TIGR04190 family B12-binding domain/radical SAM domain protein [Candidatus Limnocylindrales bacterium]
MHDLVLIHPPSVFDFRERRQSRGPIAKVIPSTEQFEMFPVGITSIAEYVARNGYRVRILNLARRMVADPGYDPVQALRRLEARVFGIDLHWLPHAHGALAVARLLRELHPDAKILLGGLSATYYHAELLRDPAIDFVIRGDSTEEPVRQLLRALRQGSPLERVESLTWRRPDGVVVANPLRPAATDLDAFELPAYRHMVRSSLTPERARDGLPYQGWWRRPLTVLLTSRGCSLDCAVCGGSRSAYRTVCSRTRPAFRSPERLIDDLRDIRAFSRSPVFLVHDPRMGGEERAARLFELLARERLPNELVFELFWPAGPELLAQVKRSVPRWSLQLTLDSQDPAIRAANGKFDASNEAVESTIEAAFAHGCRTLDVFFTVGLPGQTLESALGIADYAERLLRQFGGPHRRRLRPFVAPIAPFLDPGSRAFEDASLGYRPHARSVADHEAALLEPDWGRTLTYDSDAMTRAEIVEATYTVTERLNDLDLRFGLARPEAHAAVARGIAAARRVTATAMGAAEARARGGVAADPAVDGPWMFAKDEMNWPGSEGIQVTPRLAWIVATGLVQSLIRSADRALGRYDRHVLAG